MVPTWFRFSPTDEELIDILHQKASGNTMMSPLDFIVESNIYEAEPQDLQWNRSVALNKNERYYFCKREKDSREVTGRGWWRATSHVKTISAANGKLVGYKRPLTFHRFRDDERKRRDAIKTDWIMHEYGLHSISTKWKLCKIKYKGKERLEEDMTDNIGNNSTASVSSEPAEYSGSSTNPMSSEFAFNQEEQHQQPVPINNDYWLNPSILSIFDEMNYIGGNHQHLELWQPFSYDDRSCSMPSSYGQFTEQQNQQPFDLDLWS